ncbi:Ectonucleoside triphosphate diphosphohydrolase [Perkinsus olseni]|uniref:Ectonucleoside triphosphate diphosphohydrolase n=1 Tax=Perkinsus olseni TaxID=32597 RepID=A0A7J6QVA6_PEROL|nr:Ectonucleoside triphosphate diphosphohydrolase [Perkinsus olseni]
MAANKYRDQCDALREKLMRSTPSPEQGRDGAAAGRFGPTLADARSRINSLTEALEAKNAECERLMQEVSRLRDGTLLTKLSNRVYRLEKENAELRGEHSRQEHGEGSLERFMADQSRAVSKFMRETSDLYFPPSMYDEHHRQEPSHGIDVTVKRRLELSSMKAEDENVVDDFTPRDASWAVRNEPAFHPGLLAMNPISVTVSSMRTKSWKLLRSCREQAVRVALLALFTLLLVGVLINFGSGRLVSRGSGSLEQSIFKVVLDAGSTGTRIHVFKFRRRDGDITLERTADPEMTFFRKVDGGLSAYKENPEEARYYGSEGAVEFE